MTKFSCYRFYLFIFLVIFGSSKLHAQEFELLAKIDTIAKFATIDNFGNVFVVTPKNEILKYNPKGKFLWNYTNNNFGDIHQVDVTDPMRVILYYADYQQIVVLNNNLNEISKFTFSENPEVQITKIASANNNGFWVYDQINRELRKLTNYFVDDIRSGNIYLRDGLNLQVGDMVTDDQYVYLNDTLEGIRIFDQYGNFVKTAVIFPKMGFEVDGDWIFFFEKGKLMTYQKKTFRLEELKLPVTSEFKNVILRYGSLVILGEKDLTLWALKK